MILLGEEISKEPIQKVDVEEAEVIVKKLEYELNNSPIPGVGLAANQIGVNKAVAIVRVKDTHINLINPVLIKGEQPITYMEGCLSFPNQSVKTVRYNEITIETQDDYEYYAEQLNAKRYGKKPKEIPMFSANRRHISMGQVEDGEQESLLVSVCCQHETAHLLSLTMFDFMPKKVERNEKCPCGSGKKSKKCCSYDFWNSNLNKLFKPNYRIV